jgi:hypothetical protein
MGGMLSFRHFQSVSVECRSPDLISLPQKKTYSKKFIIKKLIDHNRLK